MKEEQAYILGTDEEELFRLGIQHQVWAEEAQTAWRLAGFRAGQTILDLGSGPGYCSTELAFLTGNSGSVIAVDKSPQFISHLKKVAELQNLPIQAICSEFEDISLDPASIDRMYCRWALAWLPNPKTVLQKVVDALKPGAVMAIHEYYDWSTLQTEPFKPGLAHAITMALKSFKDSEGEIDIGRELPSVLNGMGMEIRSTRPMAKIATVTNGIWQWPRTFFHSYFPRLIPQGYLDRAAVDLALKELDDLEKTPGSSICTPLMYEVIAQKPRN